MAGDQKVTDEDTHFRNKKIFRVGDAIVGAAGEAAAISRFLEWLHDGQEYEPPKFKKDTELDVLVLTPAGLFTYGWDCRAEEILDPFYAIGTGKQAALAAMHLGATPEQAVEIACKVDNATGGPIDVLELA